MAGHLGFTMVGCILFCFAIGYYLDKWIGTKFLFVLVFTILGIIGGGVTVYKQIDEMLNLSEKNKSSEQENKDNE